MTKLSEKGETPYSTPLQTMRQAWLFWNWQTIPRLFGIVCDGIHVFVIKYFNGKSLFSKLNDKKDNVRDQ